MGLDRVKETESRQGEDAKSESTRKSTLFRGGGFVTPPGRVTK